MPTVESRRTMLPVEFGAGNVVLLLAAMACFLAAFVVPPSFPEFGSATGYVFLALGCVFLIITALSILLRPWLSVFSQKLGIRSRTLLPREGMVYLGVMLIIAIAALTGGNPDTGNMLLLVFGMMAGPFVFNGWVVVAMLTRVKVSRHLPIAVAAETLFSVEIRLKNEKRLLSSRLVEVRDVIQGHKVGGEGKVVFVHVAPGEQRSAHYDVRIFRRGRYQFGPLRMSSSFPLGIGERGHVVAADDEVIVHPKIGRLLPAWQRRERELAETISRANARLGLFDDEFHGIREYRTGDSSRAIHWRSSARHGHFMVKEHEQRRAADLVVLLDLCSSAAFPEQLQERSISLAATICVEQTRQTSSGCYRLMIAGESLQNLECSGASRFRDEALKELALCQSSAKAELSSMLLAVCQSQLAPNCRLVLITPRPETAQLLACSIAQENLRHEQQFIGRLMIVKADEQTLDATLEFDSTSAEVVQGSETATKSISSGYHDRALPGSVSSGVLSPDDEKLQSEFFRSMTLTAAMAGAILCHSEGRYFPAALTPIVAVVAWIFVDQLMWIRLPSWVINVCGLSAVIASLYNLGQGTIEDKLLAGTHMLVYLTCIVLMMQKEYRQYWWLLALILLQMAVAAVLKTGVFFGGSMLLMMALLLWTLSVFSLYRVMDKHRNRNTRNNALIQSPVQYSPSDRESPVKNGRSHVISVYDGLGRDNSETWLGWRFRSMVTGAFAVSLVLAIFVFAAFPRVWQQGATTFAADLVRESGIAARSGFRNTVTLGHTGTLAPSQQRVLAYSVTSRKTGKPVSAEEFAAALNTDEVRFRGITLEYYHRGRWGFGDLSLMFPDIQLPQDQVPGSGNLDPEFRVEIAQDAPVGSYVFVPYPVLSMSMADKVRNDWHSSGGHIIWYGSSNAHLPRTYIVECPRVDPNVSVAVRTAPEPAAAHVDDQLRNPSTMKGGGRAPEPAAAHVDDEPGRNTWHGSASQGGVSAVRHVDDQQVRHATRRIQIDREELISVSDELPSLCEATRKLCSREGALVSEAERVRLIMQYLSPENGFEYSTVQTRHDLSRDPVEDFLFNTKSGHCEYFASACALMLQSVQIPARLVNGYYGSELNLLTGSNEIRQRHAHSWVEVFLDNRWQTLEPTPDAPRRAMITAERSGSMMRNLQTAISELWDDSVHNMSAARQKEFFAPVISTSMSLLDTIRQQGLFSAVRNGIQQFLTSPESLFSWRGGLVTFLFLFVAGLFYRLRPLARIQLAVRTLLAKFSRQKRTRQSVIRFYAGFCALCESHGMQIPEANSALENGRSAVQRFGERLDSEELRQLPIRIAMAFNDVRFGNVELTDEQAASIGRDLTLFSNALSAR